METKKILKIWKEIIYISWFYKNYDLKDKNLIEKKLISYENELKWSENPYSKKLIEFVEDLLLDLKNDRPLQIDNIFEDDFIGNYYNSYTQNKIYNSLIDREIYKKIFENKSENNELFEKFFLNFKNNFKKLDLDLISYNYLIFSIFEIDSVKKYLKRLYFFRKNLKFSYDNISKLKKMIFSYENFLEKLYKKSLQNLKNKNFSYKYIKIEKIWEEKDFELNFILKDASKHDFRSWNPVFEYKEILKNLKRES